MCNVTEDLAAKLYRLCGWARGDYGAELNSHEIGTVENWLDSLPTVPENDWELTMYSWATCCTINADGRLMLWSDDPVVDRESWSAGPNVRRLYHSFVDLPIGVDWRTTLRKRSANGK